MKIAHCSHLFYPSWGGNEIENKELSNELVNMGEEVTVYTSSAAKSSEIIHENKGGESLKKQEVIDGVKVCRFQIQYGLYRLLYRTLPNLKGGCWLKKKTFGQADEMLEHGPFIPQILWKLWTDRPDVVLTFNIFPANTYFCYLASKLFKIPLVVKSVIHMDDLWRNHPIVNKIFLQAKYVIANTDFERNYLIEAGVPSERVIKVNIGVRLEEFENADTADLREKLALGDSPVVSFVGRKTIGKGLVLLIKAMEIAWQKNPDIKLIIAGSAVNEESEEINVVMNSLKNDYRRNIIEMDQFPNEQKAAIYSVSNIFVMPSKIDSFGIVYLEAWASGTPVIALKGTPQETLIEDGVDGFLVDDNPQDLSDKIIRLISDKSLAMEMGLKGKIKVKEQYNWSDVAKQMQDIYKKAINGNNLTDELKGCRDE